MLDDIKTVGGEYLLNRLEHSQHMLGRDLPWEKRRKWAEAHAAFRTELLDRLARAEAQ